MDKRNYFNFNTSISDKSILLLSGILILIGYAYFGTNIIIAGDDWTSITRINYFGDLTITVGRWMHYTLSWLFHEKLFAPSFTFGVLVFSKLLSVYIITKLFKFQNAYQKLFFAAIFVSFPIWYEAYLFHMGRVPKAVGLLCSVLSASFFIEAFKGKISIKNTLPFLLLASAFLTISMGCYQTYSFFAIIIILIYFIQSKFENLKPFLIQGFSLIGVFGLAIIIYYMVTIAFLNFHDLKMHDGGRYDIKNVVTSSSITTTIKMNLVKITNFYTKAQLLIPQFVKLLLVFSFLIFIIKEFFIKSKEKLTKQVSMQKCLKFLCFIVIIILPFILGFIREKSPLRYNSVTSLSIVFAFFLSYPLVFKNWFSKIWLITLTAIVITFCFWNSAASFSKFVSNKRDFALTEKLLGFIHESPIYELNNNSIYNVYFVGKNPYLEQERPFDIEIETDFKIRSLINSSVWDGQIGRTKNIFKLLGERTNNFNFFPSNSKKSKGLTKNKLKRNMVGDFSEIKNWPHKNSVVSLKNGKTFIVFFDKDVLK